MERHISSLLVHGRPAALAEIAAAIGEIPGAEVPIADPGGKMVVTLETATAGEVADALARISLLDGVLAAAMVFHHVDDEP
jgi:periplasmic nitrate reductase NapD